MSFEDKLISAVTQYDELQSRKKSWNPRALGIYITRANEIASDVRRGAGQREAIIAGFTGSILSYVLRKMKLSPPTRDEFTGAGRMTYRAVRQNPPFYAHNLYEKKTHGLNLKQMRRLYAMVSRGNQKAITYARNVLGIPFSESPTQVKAVVYHHVRDLAERRGLKRNAPWSKVKNAFAKAGFQFHAYGKVDDPATGKKLYDYYKGDSLTEGQKKIIQSLIPEAEFGGSRSQYAPEIRRPVVMFPVKRGLRRNPASSDVTPVVFRTFRSGGEVIALFPYEPGTNDPWTMMSYQHIGQHGSADMGLTSVHTRPSTPDEIRPLKNELERIGYKLKILKRIPGDAVRVRDAKLRSIR